MGAGGERGDGGGRASAPKPTAASGANRESKVCYSQTDLPSPPLPERRGKVSKRKQ